MWLHFPKSLSRLALGLCALASVASAQTVDVVVPDSAEARPVVVEPIPVLPPDALAPLTLRVRGINAAAQIQWCYTGGWPLGVPPPQHVDPWVSGAEHMAWKLVPYEGWVWLPPSDPPP